MDGATQAHMKAMKRVIKYMLETKDWRQRMETNKGEKNVLKIEAYSDSDYAADRNNRRSVSGYLIMVNGCVISWRSRGQKNVTLSSSEAEYVAVSETVTEMFYIKKVWEKKLIYR